MDVQNLLKMLIKSQGLTYELIGEKLGGKSVQTISARLNKPSSMSVGYLLKILALMDCELVVRSRRRGKEEWVITSDLPEDKAMQREANSRTHKKSLPDGE